MTRLTVFKPRSLVSILMFTTVWAVGSASASTLDLEAQRAQYDKAQRWLDEKNVAQYQRIRKQIDSYPLTLISIIALFLSISAVSRRSQYAILSIVIKSTLFQLGSLRPI